MFGSAIRTGSVCVLVFVVFGCPPEKTPNGPSGPPGPQVNEPPATRTVSPGTSIQTTLNDASPGEIIELTNGVWNESVTIRKAVTLRARTNHGSKIRGIVVENGVSDVAIKRIHCDGSNIFIDGASNVTVSDCLVTNANTVAFSMNWRVNNAGKFQNHNVWFERCEAHDVAGGFFLHGYNCGFVGGRIERLIQNPGTDSDFSRVNGEDLLIADNVLYGGENSFNGAHADGVQTFVTDNGSDDFCHRISIVGNVFDGGNIGVDTGIHQVIMFEEDIGQDRVSDVLFSNNIVVKPLNHGVRARGSGNIGGVPRVTVTNNVFDRPDKGSVALAGPRTINGVCRDNILSNGGGITVESGAQAVQSNNPRYDFPSGIPHGGTLAQYRAFYGATVNGAGLRN